MIKCEYTQTLSHLRACHIITKYCSQVTSLLSDVAQVLPPGHGLSQVAVKFQSWGWAFATQITLLQYFVLPIQVKREIRFTKQERLWKEGSKMIYNTPEGHVLRNGINYHYWKTHYHRKIFKLTFRLWRFKTGFWLLWPTDKVNRKLLRFQWHESIYLTEFQVSSERLFGRKIIFRISFQSNVPKLPT